MDHMKLRIFSKRLSSGNCQVKFYFDSGTGKPCYGYMLASPGQKLSEVISRIYQKLHDIEQGSGFGTRDEAWIDQERYIEPGFMLFADNS